MTTETNIKDLATFFTYFKRGKFMQDYARVKPKDIGTYYRDVNDGDESHPLSRRDYIDLANGVALLVMELTELHRQLLSKSINYDEK